MHSFHKWFPHRWNKTKKKQKKFCHTMARRQKEFWTILSFTRFNYTRDVCRPLNEIKQDSNRIFRYFFSLDFVLLWLSPVQQQNTCLPIFDVIETSGADILPSSRCLFDMAWIGCRTETFPLCKLNFDNTNAFDRSRWCRYC